MDTTKQNRDFFCAHVITMEQPRDILGQIVSVLVLMQFIFKTCGNIFSYRYTQIFRLECLGQLPGTRGTEGLILNFFLNLVHSFHLNVSCTDRSFATFGL